MEKERNELKIVYCIGAGVLLILSMLTTVVSAQTMNLNERQVNILQQIKGKIKNNELKQSNILNIKLLKDNIKDVSWFPGSLIYIFFAFIIIISMMFGFP